jgi:hypothetical protein
VQGLNMVKRHQKQRTEREPPASSRRKADPYFERAAHLRSVPEADDGDVPHADGRREGAHLQKCHQDID